MIVNEGRAAAWVSGRAEPGEAKENELDYKIGTWGQFYLTIMIRASGFGASLEYDGKSSVKNQFRPYRTGAL